MGGIRDEQGKGVNDAALHEIADGVYAFIQPDGGWCLNNAGCVAGDDPALLVDTAATRARAERFRRVVATVSPAPPGFIVNTHSHGDHTFGNVAFPEATVIAHEGTAAEMTANGLHLTTLWPQVRWGDVAVVAPSITYRDRLTLHAGGTTAELRHFGPAHTAYDTAVWLPRERVLFAGDLVMSGVTPFVMMGSVAGLLSAVGALRALNPAVIVPGHGAVCGPEVLDATERYLRWLTGLARDGVDAGMSPVDAAKSVDLGEFGDLIDSERLVPNLYRAYAEQQGAAPGAPLDVGAMVGAMVDFHGGLPACYA